MTLRRVLLAFLLLAFLPAVLGTCVDKTVTETAWITETATPSPSPISSSASNPGATSIPSAVSTPGASSTSKTFNQLTPTPNQGSIRNSCGYDVYVWSVGCSDTASNVKIAAGTTWSEPLRRCSNGGVVYKVSKIAGDNSKVMQFEAGVWADKDMVQYDLSYLNCMVPGTTDLSACAGWEGGHQAVPGKGCQVFVCKPGEYCDGSSYTVAEFGYQGGGITHPNAGCAASRGISFELCACSKA
ncbi:hypothetical protein DM02DRAFT_591071 [Periconia macrospinosa]|uniref:Uncharacterized protein n=1 Tax=Periconia macrospinosa TaxID=97972 RepID=A0A2V1DX62_9PLEO|nr:hypothetical protein DM02DRAFT_591071 [Periconia macrospinosa]